MSEKQKVICIVGPTASGKTNIAVEVAKIIGSEVISADSRLVYRDFNIGTAKPTAEEMSGISHHLIDVATPEETYTVAKFKAEASEKIIEILNKNKTPIIAGGTGFYIKSLLEGLNLPDIRPDEDFRKEMREFTEEFGRQALYKKICDADPEIAEKLYQNDSFRIIRALEVIKATGKKMSELQTVSEPEYDVLYFGLSAENRDFLYERINHRVLFMIEQGLVAEVEGLIKKYGRTVALLKTLGYKEICEYLDTAERELKGENDESLSVNSFSIEATIANIQKNTRNFAKRQLTWFRANKKINWYFIDKMDSDTIVKEISQSFV